MQQHHGHQHGAFVDAEKAAVKLNAPGRDAWQRPDEILAALDLRAGDTVADIGAGTGYMVAHLSKAVGEKGTVIAVDAEEAMIAYLSNRIEELGPATIRLQKAGPHDPNLTNESVDAILILETYHHIGHSIGGRIDYAKKVHAALKPGGRLVVVESGVDAEIGPPQEMRVAPDDVVRELADAGLRAERLPAAMPRHYMVVGRKLLAVSC